MDIHMDISDHYQHNDDGKIVLYGIVQGHRNISLVDMSCKHGYNSNVFKLWFDLFCVRVSTITAVYKRSFTD